MRSRHAIAVLMTTLWMTILGVGCPEPGPVIPEQDTIYQPDIDVPPVENHGLLLIAVEVDPAELAALNANNGTMPEVMVKVTMNGRSYHQVALTLHGGFARTVPKKSYRLEFPDDDKPDVTFFSEKKEEHRRLVLQACWNDPTYIRNKLTHDLVLALGGLAPRSGFAELSFNGAVFGLFSVIERIDRLYLKRNGLNADGNVFKAVNHNANWKSKANPMEGYELKVNKGNPTDDLGPFLKTLTETELTVRAYGDHIEPLLDINGWMTWQISQSFAMNRDTFTKNYYLYHDRTAPSGTAAARFGIISWDSDATWGNNWNGDELDPIDAKWHGTDAFAPRILSIPYYRDAYLQRFQDSLEGPLDPTQLTARVQTSVNAIREAALADAIRWNRSFDFDREIKRIEAAITTRHQVISDVVRRQRD
jgi:spore coat protein H